MFVDCTFSISLLRIHDLWANTFNLKMHNSKSKTKAAKQALSFFLQFANQNQTHVMYITKFKLQ